MIYVKKKQCNIYIHTYVLYYIYMYIIYIYTHFMHHKASFILPQHCRPTHRSARPQSWEGDVKLLKGVTCHGDFA